MAEIVEPLQALRVLAAPKRFAPLRGFSCGRHGQRWERSVNQWARGLYLGTETEADTQTVIVLEDANRRLVGVGSFRAETVPNRRGRLADRLFGTAQCVHMVAVDRLWQGGRLADGSRLGDVLLRGLLDRIEAANDGRMPYVWALVSPENGRGQALFDRHGFGQLRYAGEGEIIRVRPPHRRLRLVPVESHRTPLKS